MSKPWPAAPMPGNIKYRRFGFPGFWFGWDDCGFWLALGPRGKELSYLSKRCCTSLRIGERNDLPGHPRGWFLKNWFFTWGGVWK